MSGFYIHVPFCVRRCPYCSFYSEARGLGSKGLELQRRYGRAFERECERLPEGFRPSTIYLGGGTPTELSPKELGRLLAGIGERAGHAVEWSCEVNPGTLTKDITTLLRDRGVNRVSLGVQSLEDDQLTFLGRIHSADEAREAFDMLRVAGFDNISLDLMFALPDMNLNQLDRQLSSFIDMDPEHISCYALSFEPDTPLEQNRAAGRVRPVPDARQREQYERIRMRLTEAGYEHYEISNFARPGYACRHNLLYWGGGEYIGRGPSACSHWHGERFGNVSDLDAYCSRLEAGVSAEAFRERLDAEAKAREILVMGLRRVDGIDEEMFGAWTGLDLNEFLKEEIDALCDRDLLTWEKGRLRLTEQALFVSDVVFRALI